MKEIFSSTIKKEEKPFTIFQSYIKQEQKKEPYELNTKSVSCFSYPSFMSTISSSKSKAKLFIGNKCFSKTLKDDQKLIDKVKRHLDQEYLEKYRNKYVFVQSPPRNEIPAKSSINMEINLSSPKRETNEKSKKSISDNENQRKEKTKKSKVKKEKLDDIRPKKSTKINSDDDLPIALRRTKRPSTKPLRYWLGEKIVYKIDNETGCYTKAFELTIDDSEDSTNKQEFFVKKNSVKEFTAKNKGKKFTVENGEIHLLINGKIFKASEGCVFYIPKGQKMTFDNKSDDDIKISFI